MYDLQDMKETNQLRDAYGDDIILYDDRERSMTYKLLAEFLLGDRGYAVLQRENAKNEEPELFRVTSTAGGELELETIDDDEEWENVSELYDEMTFPQDEM
ncbi:DUF1292 domain-containing protein [Paenibacillus doosanensis]|uniref:DUF1292 domain-containing protein n=1 Tax=Paenibacillus konkukensis TaxID=2020716 RepID=A0ABY4RML2_9BACL|nr:MULTISPECIES: DUF1292 domain-containing protein [Paenibacillus]MCS7462642.1 DUF1292 domain-containing protein [Paenibacillus doosanensis]UQZ82537.1 hypothetical protein SK3146_01694 [Paenibacillus konkukensis]